MKKFSLFTLIAAFVMLLPMSAFAHSVCPTGYTLSQGQCYVTNPGGGEGGAGGTATITDNSKTYNTNTNVNSNSNKNDNTNVNLNSNKNDNFNSNKNTNIQGQDQKQGQIQGQGQVQGQSVNNAQTISPTQTTSQSLTQIVNGPEPGAFRQFVPGQEQILPQFIRPDAPKIVKGYIPVDRLPKRMTMAEAKELGKDAKATLELASRCKWGTDEIVVVKDAGDGVNFVTGYGKTSASAWAKALEMAMSIGCGGVKVSLVTDGVTTVPSSIFVGIGSSYTHASVEGSAKDLANTSGGSGLFGWSKGLTSTVFFYTFVIYR